MDETKNQFIPMINHWVFLDGIIKIKGENKMNKAQKNFKEAEDTNGSYRWIVDPEPKLNDGDNEEVIKLKPGETIMGELIDVMESKKWEGLHIYKIERDNEKTAVILGTTMLNRLLKNKKIGDFIKIERCEDQPTTKGSPLQVYKTYSLES
jgi:hypothetical protein